MNVHSIKPRISDEAKRRIKSTINLAEELRAYMILDGFFAQAKGVDAYIQEQKCLLTKCRGAG